MKRWNKNGSDAKAADLTLARNVRLNQGEAGPAGQVAVPAQVQLAPAQASAAQVHEQAPEHVVGQPSAPGPQFHAAPAQHNTGQQQGPQVNAAQIGYNQPFLPQALPTPLQSHQGQSYAGQPYAGQPYTGNAQTAQNNATFGPEHISQVPPEQGGPANDQTAFAEANLHGQGAYVDVGAKRRRVPDRLRGG